MLAILDRVGRWKEFNDPDEAFSAKNSRKIIIENGSIVTIFCQIQVMKSSSCRLITCTELNL